MSSQGRLHVHSWAGAMLANAEGASVFFHSGVGRMTGSCVMRLQAPSLPRGRKEGGINASFGTETEMADVCGLRRASAQAVNVL